jgi:methylenetetrahydrofolate reductase (NADPH)
MSKLREALESGQFALVVELKPPKGTAVAEMLAPLTALQGRVTAFGAPDNEQARMRLSALAACRLIKEGGGEPFLHLTCRDRNRLALESDLLGAAVLGIENVLIVSGDYVTLGDHPDAKPVYDADSVQLLQVAQGLMAGQDSAGLPLNGQPTFFLGAVVIPEAEPWGPQRLKFEKKVAAGAQFFVTPPVFDLEKLRTFLALKGKPVKLLATVKVLEPEEVAQAGRGELRQVYSLPSPQLQELAGLEGEEFTSKAAEVAGRLLKEIRKENLAHGVYLKAQGRSDLISQVLEQAGF